MAKRRNLKKEKALRNEAYARKFRKRTNRSRYNRRRPEGGTRPEEENLSEGTEQDAATED